MSAPEQSRRVVLSWLALLAGGASVALLAFAGGFVPMWIKAENRQQQLRLLTSKNSIINLQNTLASAAIDARRGEYELARKETSEFYTGLRAALEATGKSSFSVAQRQGLEELMVQRDDVITLLARSDPASAERLSNLHVSFRRVIGPSANVD